MKQPLSLLFIASVWMCACMNPPTEQAIRKKIVGVYCSPPYRLQLTDSAYISSRTNASIPPETCSGKYRLQFTEHHWEIHFLPDTVAGQIMLQCEKIYTLWTQKEGYLIGYDTLVLRDVIDNKPVEKGDCK
jgi:hypothetical protein